MMVAFLTVSACQLSAQQDVSRIPSEGNKQWRSGLTVHLVGYEDIPKGDSGIVEITSRDVAFVRGEEEVRLSRSQIISAAEDDERRETGGAAGKIVRFAVPYGGGALIGAFSQKQVGLLTLDYIDMSGGLHSAVFIMSKADATVAADQLALDALVHPSTVHTATPSRCDGAQSPLVLRVSTVDASQGVVLAPEYRAVLYEHLVQLPKEKTHFDRMMRQGDSSAECAPYVLSLHVEKLSKGSDVARTVSGPAGLFVSVTKVHVHVVVSDQNGNVVLDRVVKSSRRGDSESLNAADSAANAIAKSLRHLSSKVLKQDSE